MTDFVSMYPINFQQVLAWYYWLNLQTQIWTKHFKITGASSRKESHNDNLIYLVFKARTGSDLVYLCPNGLGSFCSFILPWYEVSAHNVHLPGEQRVDVKAEVHHGGIPGNDPHMIFLDMKTHWEIHLKEIVKSLNLWNMFTMSSVRYQL